MGCGLVGMEMGCGVVGIEMGWGGDGMWCGGDRDGVGMWWDGREGGMQKNANVSVLRIRYSVNILHTSLVASDGNLNSTEFLNETSGVVCCCCWWWWW